MKGRAQDKAEQQRRSIIGDESIDDFSLDSESHSASTRTARKPKKRENFNPLKGWVSDFLDPLFFRLPSSTDLSTHVCIVLLHQFVYVTLIIAAIGFGFATYFLISTSQQNEFEAEVRSRILMTPSPYYRKNLTELRFSFSLKVMQEKPLTLPKTMQRTPSVNFKPSPLLLLRSLSTPKIAMFSLMRRFLISIFALKKLQI